jgi:prepilin-type N-terminal cleavage/methylation domain-containing protein
MVKKINKNKFGFSIIEVLVALVIISIGMLAISSLVIQNLQVESVNKNYIIASMLAQEGLELVRNLRDKNWMTTGASWDDNIYNPGDDTFVLDYLDNIPFYNPGDISENATILHINNNGNYVRDINSPVTPFHRLIYSTMDNGHLNISCLIHWSERGRTYKYQADTQLYNWW